ncbi:MAG: uroporphyrinogen-III decarboxylase [Actinobacteria bacterium]|nr:uroporphyrinogen-III decarboxylase [Actinomycetota bacterium]
MDAATQRLLEEKERRIRDAVALKTPDRVPIVPLGDAFTARQAGVKVSDFCTDPQIAYRTMIEVFSGLGELDGIQHANYNVHLLSTIWLSRLKIPGRDLGENDAWQVEEIELMTPEDYDAILDEGFGPWLERYFAERLPGTAEAFAAFVATLPDAFAAWREKGIVVFSPVLATVPYEYFCGGRSMQQFMLDMHRRPDKVQAAMDAALPFLKEQMRQVIRGLSLMGLWIGGWRTASEFLSPRLWERFVFPYYKELVDVAIEEGAIPVLHFDADWTRDLERLLELPKGKCVLSLDGKTDIFKAKEILGDHMCIMGDVPPRMLSLGTPAEVTAYCKRLINEVGPGGFILAQGCCIPPDAKYENVKAMIDSVQ